MANYNLKKAPKNIEARFYNAYREDLEKIGVTQKDIDERGVPDLDKSKPPKGRWSDGNVTETGISYLEDALREYYNKPLLQEEQPKPEPEQKKVKTPRTRKTFRTNIPKTGVDEDLSTLFKTVSSLPAPKTEKEVEKKVGPKLPKELERASPRYKFGYDDPVPILFANDIDKSAYIISSKSGTKSKRHDDFVKWASKVTGWDELQLRKLGMKIKSQMKEFYKKYQEDNDSYIRVPDFYNKFKNEIDSTSTENLDEEAESIEQEQEKIIDDTESVQEEKVDLPKPKRTRARAGQLTKKQEELLHNILSDLIKIKQRLVEIKDNQDAKIAYEKNRDRLQAERLSFLEREKEIEAIPKSDSEKSKFGKSDKGKSQKDRGLSDILGDLIKTAIISAIGSLLFGGENDIPEKTKDNKPEKNKENEPAKFAEGGIIGPTTMLPFADGGSITPLESASGETQIQPLESEIKTSSATSETTFSRGFSLDDLKSPLAEVMKLPLKVAGAALLSAISRMASQFDISDSKLQSDLSKMIGDVSKAFGLEKPSFGTTKVENQNISLTGDKNNEQANLALAINNVADGLKGTDKIEVDEPDKNDKKDADKKTPPSSPQTPSSTSTEPSTSSSTPPPSAEKNEPPAPGTPVSGVFRTNSTTSIPSNMTNGMGGNSLKISSTNIGDSTINNSIGGNFSSSFSSSNPRTSNTLSNNFSQNNFASSISPLSLKSDNYNLDYSSKANFNSTNINPSGKPSNSYYAYMGLNPYDDNSPMYNNDIQSIVLPSKVINTPTPSTINNEESTSRLSKQPSGFSGVCTTIRASVMA